MLIGNDKRGYYNLLHTIFFIIDVKRGYHNHILMRYSVTGKNSVVTKTLKLLFFNVEGHMF